MSKRTKRKRAEVEYGYVVQICERRAGHGRPQYYCDYDKAPAGFAKAVGMGDLDVAEFFKSHSDAAVCAFWQIGTVHWATREKGIIKILS